MLSNGPSRNPLKMNRAKPTFTAILFDHKKLGNVIEDILEMIGKFGEERPNIEEIERVLGEISVAALGS